MLVLPEILSFARKYYNCDSIDGLPLENDGTDGTKDSHWEKTYFPNEYMNPTIENPGIITNFTMVLLQSTGWYTVSSGAAQYYDWGKADGCDYFSICPKGNEYCSTAQLDKNLCTVDHLGKASCTAIPDFVGTCNIVRAIPSTICYKENDGSIPASQLETYGPHSRCIEWIEKSNPDQSIRFAQCHKAKVGVSLR